MISLNNDVLFQMNDSWKSGEAYEIFMGRWSTLVCGKFLDWFKATPNSIWLDVGCGTGSLTKLIVNTQSPGKVIAVDSSGEFISYTQSTITNPLVELKVGLAESLDIDSNSVDAVVSGLVLNFLTDPELAVKEMIRVANPGGKIGIFIWDYSRGMQMLTYFWDAAARINTKAKKFDEGIRFPICKKGRLEALVKKTGLENVESTAIEIKTYFKNFNDYWEPFLGNVGPAPNYVMSLSNRDREELEHKLRSLLPVENDGSINLAARAWAVKGIKK